MNALRRTKIVCSIGPASQEIDNLIGLIDAGMNVARVNMSHGTYAEHLNTIENVREAARRSKATIGILGDLCGPKLRITGLPSRLHLVKPGDQFVVTEDEPSQDPEEITITSLGVLGEVEVGDVIAFADGAVRGLVQECSDHGVAVLVTQGGSLAVRKGVNLPDSRLSIPAMTEKDYQDALFLLGQEVDFIALSFVGSAHDLELASEFIRANNEGHPMPRLIAKIERRDALGRISEIIDKADAVMVARGDLGVEIPVEEVPIEQKRIIHLANARGKMVITATQMLESMISAPTPTRAEASDVANAILDGTDAIMLSAETAVGSYPIEAVGQMDRIARATEAIVADQSLTLLTHPARAIHSTADAIGFAAADLSRNLSLKVVVAVTESGHSARTISRYRPSAMIVGATPDAFAARSLTLSYGVIPVIIPRSPSTEVMVQEAIEAAIDLELCETGDVCAFVAGIPFGVRGTTNLIKIQVVGEGFLSINERFAND
ncbi:MAG: pyruvate kinase [Ferrimicrobium sp.]|uniref:pyruvate kinase n=1 Tax=Ferrimicrobium sp. TaxID=2926050 RepID=UPI00262FCC15|nr:pyruvate kinase [Ferrimicrobium sp.]